MHSLRSGFGTSKKANLPFKDLNKSNQVHPLATSPPSMYSWSDDLPNHIRAISKPSDHSLSRRNRRKFHLVIKFAALTHSYFVPNCVCPMRCEEQPHFYRPSIIIRSSLVSCVFFDGTWSPQESFRLQPSVTIYHNIILVICHTISACTSSSSNSPFGRVRISIFVQ